jgi:hypothetical protein
LFVFPSFRDCFFSERFRTELVGPTENETAIISALKAGGRPSDGRSESRDSLRVAVIYIIGESCPSGRGDSDAIIRVAKG